jgi:Heterokaryon incompatibility protein (HET)
MHGPLCSKAAGRTTRTDLRLEDISRRCLVDATTECNYVAPSYVWGQGYKSTYRLDLSSIELFYRPGGLPDRPHTIEDAIEVSLRLGYEYLFVDALCIVQDQPSEARLYIS